MISWQHEMANAFRSYDQLEEFCREHYPQNLNQLKKYSPSTQYKLFIPRQMAHHLFKKGLPESLGRQFISSSVEDNQSGLIDPIGDHKYSPAAMLIHRYNNRALFTPTTICPINCRYCFRKNELQISDDFLRGQFEDSLNYLQAHPEINEIIFTGGDPLILSNEKIDRYLEAFSHIKSIRFIRFHTRTPVILPQRLDDGFASIVNKWSKHFSRLTLVLHINHSDEWSEELSHSLKIFKQHAPINLLSQSVFLHKVNDNLEDLVNLFELLIQHQVDPYYLHHPDQARGAQHFYLPLEQGRKIYAQLQNRLPGWAIPKYVIDIPMGEGKTSAFNPESYQYHSKLINKEGNIISVPLAYESSLPYNKFYGTDDPHREQ